MSTINQAAPLAAAIEARVAQISVANGFNTEIGSRVLRGRRRIDDNQVPCVVIAEGLDTATPGPGRLPTVEVSQTYMLIAYHECDPDHPNDMAHLMIKDLKRAIFHDGVTLGGNVRRVKYSGRDIGPRADGVGIVCASIEIVVEFVEDLSNP